MKEPGLILKQLDGHRILIRASDVLRISETMSGTCVVFQDGSFCQVCDKFEEVIEEMGRIVQ